METKDIVLGIMNELMPAKDLTDVKNIVEGGHIDSIELVSLIATLSDRFDVEIDIDDMTPENFNSVDGIAALISRLLETR